MSDSVLLLTNSDVETICAYVKRYGALGVETGGMLVTSPRDETVVLIALAGTRDVRRGWGLFQLQGPAIAALFDYVEDRDLQVAAMFHSHKYEAFLSPVDRELGINRVGFTNIVLPAFEDPPSDLGKWGWWDFDGHSWQDRSPGHLHQGSAATRVIFDGDGVREF